MNSVRFDPSNLKVNPYEILGFNDYAGLLREAEAENGETQDDKIKSAVRRVYKRAISKAHTR